MTTPPAGNEPAPAPAPDAPAPAPAPNALFDGLEGDDLNWIKGKGYDKLTDPTQVARAAMKAHRNAEKLIGIDKGDMLIVPKGDEDWGKVYDKLGRPPAPEGYKFEGEMADDFKAWAPKAFHEIGLNQKQASALVDKYNEMVSTAGEKSAFDSGNKLAQDKAALAAEWGARHDTNMGQAKSVVAKLGLPAEAIDGLESALGYSGTVKLLQGLAAKLGEANFVAPDAGDKGDLPMTPDQAKRELRVFQASRENLAAMTDKTHPDGPKLTHRMRQLTAWANGRAL